MIALVNVIVAVGMLVVVPLGLSLLGHERLARLWLVPGVLGALSLWLPRGPVAVTLAAAYAAAALALAATAPRHLNRTPSSLATATALVSPAIAATALVAERAGHTLFGFDLEILALTVPHLHFAGFAAALVAGLVARATSSSPLAVPAALAVPGGTALVLVGYFLGDGWELAGAIVLTAGMWAVGVLTWRELRPADATTRALLRISAATLATTMVLALSYAVGEAFELPHLTHTWMAATHGVANALGFAVCGLLAWHRLERTPR
jgi:hypothetical protein